MNVTAKVTLHPSALKEQRVAAGGPERLDDPMGLGKAKGKGKKGKGDKGGGKGGKGGVWTAAGDHGVYWLPTRAQIKGSGGFPFLRSTSIRTPGITMARALSLEPS